MREREELDGRAGVDRPGVGTISRAGATADKYRRCGWVGKRVSCVKKEAGLRGKICGRAWRNLRASMKKSIAGRGEIWGVRGKRGGMHRESA